MLTVALKLLKTGILEIVSFHCIGDKNSLQTSPTLILNKKWGHNDSPFSCFLLLRKISFQ